MWLSAATRKKRYQWEPKVIHSQRATIAWLATRFIQKRPNVPNGGIYACLYGQKDVIWTIPEQIFLRWKTSKRFWAFWGGIFFLSVHLILYSWPMKIVWLWRLWCDSPLMASEASPSQQCQNHQISTSNSFFLGKESSSFLREKGNCLWCLNSNPIPGDPKLILISFRKEVTFHQNWDFFTHFPTLCGNVITTYQFQEVLKE